MKNIKLPFFIVVLVVLAACSDPRPPEEIVAERAQARWDALVAQDFKTAWKYNTPGSREQLSPREFSAEMARRPVVWTAADVANVDCEPAERRCTVNTRVEYEIPSTIPGIGKLSTPSGTTEIWLQLEGQWWYSSES